MSQHDLDIANQTFPATRADITAFLTAISSQQSGASDPPTTVQFQYFADTTNNLLKRRNVGDSAFLPFDTLLDLRVETKVANYTQVLADMRRTINLDGTAGNLTVDLLDAAVAGNGHETTWKRIDATIANTVILDAFGGQTIDGQGTLELFVQDDVVNLISDGTNWRIKSKNLAPTVVYAHGRDASAEGSTFVSYAWPTQVIDTHDAFDGTTFTVPRTGKYQITVVVNRDVAAGTALEGGFDINASVTSLEFGFRQTNDLTGIVSNSLCHVSLIQLTAADLVVLRLRTNSASATIRDSVTSSGVTIDKLTSISIHEVT